MTFHDPLLTKADVATLLRCCERTIERQVRIGRFPPAQRFGRESLWFQSVVHGWLAHRQAQQLRWVEAHVASTIAQKPPMEAGRPLQQVSSLPLSRCSTATDAERVSRGKPRRTVGGAASVFSQAQLERVSSA